jgi:hypothetical protein
VSFTDQALGPGSTHTYTIDAVDEAGNPSAMSTVSDPITVLAPDVTPPSDPGTPTGVSDSTSAIDLSWPAAADDESTTLTYRIYRDDESNQVGTVVSDSTTTVDFTDVGLAPGSAHSYWVDAVDESENASSKVPSGPIQVLSPIFRDRFDSGDFSRWTAVTRLTIDATNGSGTPPSARGNATAQSAFAYLDLATTIPSACFSTRLNAAALAGNSVDLMRLRTAGGGALAKVFANASGTLFVRSDVSGAQISSGVALGSGWHTIEICGAVGTAGAWDLYRDGAKIVSAWTADTGTSPIGRIYIGDTAAKTWTINFDDVILDTEPGHGAEPDTTAPTVPGRPTGVPAGPTSITIGWSVSFDDSPPITYRIYRDGAELVGSTIGTSFTDTGLAPGSLHTYTVDAVDSVQNASVTSPLSDPISTASTIFADDFATGDLSNWTSVTNLSIDGAAGAGAPPSAIGSPVAQAAYAYRDLSVEVDSACLSVAVNPTSLGGNAVDLVRMRTSTGGPIAKVFVNASGILSIRSDFSNAQISSGVGLESGWHTIELCGTVGTATTWDLYRDGSRIVNSWTAATGSTPIGRIQIGDTAVRTWTINVDDVRLDTAPG